MVSARGLVAVVVLLMLSAGAPLQATPELDELLARLPAGCETVVGTPDAPAAVRALRAWLQPAADEYLPEDMALELTNAFDKAERIMSGPTASGWPSRCWTGPGPAMRA